MLFLREQCAKASQSDTPACKFSPSPQLCLSNLAHQVRLVDLVCLFSLLGVSSSKYQCLGIKDVGRPVPYIKPTCKKHPAKSKKPLYMLSTYPIQSKQASIAQRMTTVQSSPPPVQRLFDGLQSKTSNDRAVLVGLTYDKLDIVAAIDHVRDSKAGAIVTFIGMNPI